MWKSVFGNTTLWMVESSAAKKRMWKSEFQKRPEISLGLGCKLRCLEKAVEISMPKDMEFPQGIRRKLRCVAMWKSEFQDIPKSPRDLVASSAVWKTMWQAEFRNATKSLWELVESSAFVCMYMLFYMPDGQRTRFNENK